jgi:hypothetical protein
MRFYEDLGDGRLAVHETITEHQCCDKCGTSHLLRSASHILVVRGERDDEENWVVEDDIPAPEHLPYDKSRKNPLAYEIDRSERRRARESSAR